MFGTKLAMNRLTMAVCNNISGNHKIQLFIIIKSKKPGAFKYVNMASLPINDIKIGLDGQFFV